MAVDESLAIHNLYWVTNLAHNRACAILWVEQIQRQTSKSDLGVRVYTLTEILRSLCGRLNCLTRFFTIFFVSNGTAIFAYLLRKFSHKKQVLVSSEKNKSKTIRKPKQKIKSWKEIRERGSQELGLALEPPSIPIGRFGRVYIGEGLTD